MPPTTPASVQVQALARDLYRIGPKQRRKLQANIGRIGQSALSDARSRAGAWSSRIPGAIEGKPVTDMTRGSVGYMIRVRLSAAPHGRAFEGLGQGGSFRHPVFGNRDVWVSQPTRPFVWPAVSGRRSQIQSACLSAFEDAARECGFR